MMRIWAADIFYTSNNIKEGKVNWVLSAMKQLKFEYFHWRIEISSQSQKVEFDILIDCERRLKI